MSRVGKLPIIIPEGIKVEKDGSLLRVSNGKVTREYEVAHNAVAEIKDNEIIVKTKDENDANKTFVGTHRSNINGIVKGLKEGFTKTLIVDGVGYKSLVKGNTVILSLGYSHDILYAIPEGIEMKTEKPNLLVVSGYDKVQVGQVAAEIRSLRKPEPYKGKGIRYQDEVVYRKEGKKK